MELRHIRYFKAVAEEMCIRDREVGRFVNADDPGVIFAKPQELYHKNLYVYCDNNPVVRRDLQGYFWETLFDIVSLGASVVEAVSYTHLDVYKRQGNSV